MEGKNKTQIIYETAGIQKENIRKILINEDELFLVKTKLDKLGWQNTNNQFFVNITGGTKLMSIAVKEYFTNYNSRFFYVPIGKNIYKEIFDNKQNESFNFNYRISLTEYLNLHNIIGEITLKKFTEKKLFSQFKKYKKSEFKSFPWKIDKGKWFEEFLYHKIKSFLNLEDKFINCSIKLFDRDTNNNNRQYDNEIDLIFVHNNSIFIIEAKMSLYNFAQKKQTFKIDTETLASYLYKLTAINKRFGINSRAILITLADFSELSQEAYENIETRIKILGINFPFDRNSIMDDNIFYKKLNKFIK